MSLEIELNQVRFRNAIVSNIELENGTQTQIITIFNNQEFNFEEMKIGIDTSLNRINKDYNPIKSVQTTFNSIQDAKLKPFAVCKKQEFYNLKPNNNERNI
ncbi:hypothetical protein K5L04_10410 [Flavobacterium psychrophilum]|uniref:hypothetical protein n=1 Tax=Flavobacterium psychrophilum TaxID=96345 RepID=UPI001C8F83B6|nr:hypothetical protein [Flavobacterium psychrophilum]QZL00105.1 hypothetical protein K5L04_10410 [Flavobacterium psychrophilum]